ncbi:hypothetical protein BDV10DRAFT_29749 [Aspergillus recurvatus]
MSHFFFNLRAGLSIALAIHQTRTTHLIRQNVGLEQFWQNQDAGQVALPAAIYQRDVKGFVFTTLTSSSTFLAPAWVKA